MPQNRKHRPKGLILSPEYMPVSGMAEPLTSYLCANCVGLTVSSKDDVLGQFLGYHLISFSAILPHLYPSSWKDTSWASLGGERVGSSSPNCLG